MDEFCYKRKTVWIGHEFGVGMDLVWGTMSYPTSVTMKVYKSYLFLFVLGNLFVFIYFFGDLSTF